MDKNELLKYLICEIDLVMHGKDYRFENEDGTWYSRESCKNLTNEEVFEELKSELRQLAKIEDNFADLEAKLAESESKLRVGNSSLASSQLEYNQLKKEYDEQEKLLSQVLATNSRLQFDYDQLKQQLAEKDAEIKQLKSQSAVDEDWLCSQRARLTEFEDEFALLEKSNLSLTNDLTELQKYVTGLQKELEESKHQTICAMMKKNLLELGQNQTAIAELEKVKNLFKEEFKDKWVEDCGVDYCEWDNYDTAIKIIDQQIKSLKGDSQ